MNQLSDKDLELAKKHGIHDELKYYCHTFSSQELAAFLAERDAEQQPKAVGFYNKHTGELKNVITSDDGDENDWLDVVVQGKQQPNAEAVGLEEFIESLYAAGWKSSGDAQWTQITALHAKLFTHPSQVITRDRLIEILDGHSSDFGHDSCVFAVREEDYANAVDAILAEINRSQETKL